MNAYVRAKENLVEKAINSTEDEMIFPPYKDAMHFLTLCLQEGNETALTVTLTNDTLTKNTSHIKLVRKSLPDFFSFDYEHLLGNENKSSPINLTADVLSVLKFDVGSVYDTGGTVTVGVHFPTDESKDKKNNVVVVGCVSLGGFFLG